MAIHRCILSIDMYGLRALCTKGPSWDRSGCGMDRIAHRSNAQQVCNTTSNNGFYRRGIHYAPEITQTQCRGSEGLDLWDSISRQLGLERQEMPFLRIYNTLPAPRSQATPSVNTPAGASCGPGVAAYAWTSVGHFHPRTPANPSGERSQVFKNKQPLGLLQENPSGQHTPQPRPEP